MSTSPPQAKPQRVAIVGALIKPGTKKVPGPFIVSRKSLSTYSGVCTVFRELLQGPPTHYAAYEDLDNLGQLELDDWEDDNRARGITGLPDNIYVFHEDIPLAGSVASVARFNYETNFDAFFIKTMIFYCENDDREKYSVVFGQVEDMDLMDLWKKVSS